MKWICGIVDYVCGLPFLIAGFCFEFAANWFVAGIGLYRFYDEINRDTLYNALSTAGLVVVTRAKHENMLLVISRQNEEIKALEYRITTLLRPS
jgi:hypothetical protein